MQPCLILFPAYTPETCITNGCKFVKLSSYSSYIHVLHLHINSFPAKLDVTLNFIAIRAMKLHRHIALSHAAMFSPSIVLCDVNVPFFGWQRSGIKVRAI